MAHDPPVPHHRRAWSSSLVLALAVLGACPEGPPVRSSLGLRGPEPSGTAPAPAEPAHDSALAEQMHERFAWVSAIQEVTIHGDVAEARSLAGELLARLPAPDEPAPEPWRPHVNALRGELEGLTHADDLRDTGASVARLALACGRCHADVQVHPELPELPEPVQGGTIRDAMHGHQWAVDRMWEGLIGPSDERWIRGSTMFVALPGCKALGAAGDDLEGPPRMATTEAGDAEGQALCRHAQSLARRGHVTRSLEGRATIYGRLLATCAECHAGAGRAGTVPPAR